MKLKIAFAASAALLLSGCNLFNGNSSGMSAAAEADMSTYFAQRLAAGRAHLENGRPTLAIAAFRQASYDPALAAEAYNGMAVSYARIGREDVARHFFTQAVSRAPQDERFARNLTRLEGQMAMLAANRAAAASTTDAAVARAIEGQLAEVVPAARQPVTVGADANTGLVRVSKYEVRLASPAQGLPQETTAGKAAVRVTTGTSSSYPVRVKVATPQSGKPRNYPVRVSMAPSS